MIDLNPTTSDSTVCTDSSTGSVRTSRLSHRRCRQPPGWSLLAGMPPIPCVSQCNKVLSMSCHSSPHDGLATFVDRITLTPFPWSLTTTSFQRSSTGRFEARSCKPAPGGHLPSSVQHHELALVFVTHTIGLPFRQRRFEPYDSAGREGPWL